MLEKILPIDIYEVLKNKVNLSSVNEIRLRENKPIVLAMGSQRVFLGGNGITGKLQDALKVSKIMIEDIIFRASECSIYSVNEQLKRGYLVTKGGIRLGIGGDLVEEAGKTDAPGKPMSYRTTTNFLKMFGYMNLESLPSLPKYKMDENQQIVIDDILEEQRKENEEAPNPEREDEEKE